MATLYQLPCTSCDQSMQIGVTQAGEELNCTCGVQILVPTLREIKALPAVESPEASPPLAKPAWSPGQGALFAIGVLLLASGLYMHVRLSTVRDKIDLSRPEFVENDDIKQLDLFSAWRVWEQVGKMTKGSGELPYRRTPEFIARRNEHARLTRNLMASWAVAGAGAVGIASAFAVRGFSRNH